MPNRSSGEKTKIILADSLRSLIKKKPFDKIKIREIVDECGLNRQTFYYHFQDVYALVEWMYRFDGEQIVKQNYHNKDVLSVCREMLNYIDIHREELVCIIDSKAEVYFVDFLVNGINQCFELYIEKKIKGRDIPEEYRRYLSMFYTNAVVGVAIDWIKSGDANVLSSEEMLEMYRVTMLGSINLALKNYCSSHPAEE